MDNPYFQDAGLTADGIFLKVAFSRLGVERVVRKGVLNKLYKAFKSTKQMPGRDAILKAQREAIEAAPSRVKMKMKPSYYRQGLDTPGTYTDEGLQFVSDMSSALKDRISRGKFLRNAGLVGAAGLGGGALYGSYANQQGPQNTINYY